MPLTRPEPVYSPIGPVLLDTHGVWSGEGSVLLRHRFLQSAVAAGGPVRSRCCSSWFLDPSFPRAVQAARVAISRRDVAIWSDHVVDLTEFSGPTLHKRMRSGGAN